MFRRSKTLTLIALVASLSGCIMAARKSIGTIIGPRGKMELVEQNGTVQAGESVNRVIVTNNIGDEATPEDIDMLQQAIEDALRGADLYGGRDADMELTMELTRHVDRPAKKVLELTATLTRGDDTVAVAHLTADLNGFGDHAELSQAIGKASVEFLQHLGPKD